MLHVTQGGRVVGPEGTKVMGPEVTVFYLDTATHKFHEWDGLSYGITNPVLPGDSGSYGLLLPQGTYYVRVSAPGFQPVVSTIFTLHSTEDFPKILLSPKSVQLSSVPGGFHCRFRQKTVTAEIDSVF